MTARPPGRAAAADIPRGGTRALPDPLPDYTPRDALHGRRALVVGGLAGPGSASGGPARAVAAVLAKEGAAVAVADTTRLTGLAPGARPVPRQRLIDDPVLSAAGLVSALGAWSLPIHCDPASESEGRAAAAYTALEFGALDLLVVCGSAAAPGTPGSHRTGGLGAAVSSGSDSGPFLGPGSGLGPALRMVRAARPFLSEGAAAVLLGERGGPHPGGPRGRAALRSFADSLSERRVRLNCLAPRAADTDAAIAAAVAGLSAGDGRSGEVVGVARVPRFQ